MEVLMIILLIITVSVINIACFLIGAKIGTGKEVKSPAVIYRDHKEKKTERIESERELEEAKREIEKLEAIERNLERYNGTGAGQEDIV